MILASKSHRNSRNLRPQPRLQSPVCGELRDIYDSYGTIISVQQGLQQTHQKRAARASQRTWGGLAITTLGVSLAALTAFHPNYIGSSATLNGAFITAAAGLLTFGTNLRHFLRESGKAKSAHENLAVASQVRQQLQSRFRKP